ncbi:MAG: 2-oxo acid dehydrogenase subunit E2 [Gammaproteobacteria bacterium]|nr:MAG: 2-oxo acid dehydrogenase subunit E2 [Gammaproteobacteria bacterium]
MRCGHDSRGRNPGALRRDRGHALADPALAEAPRRERRGERAPHRDRNRQGDGRTGLARQRRAARDPQAGAGGNRARRVARAYRVGRNRRGGRRRHAGDRSGHRGRIRCGRDRRGSRPTRAARGSRRGRVESGGEPPAPRARARRRGDSRHGTGRSRHRGGRAAGGHGRAAGARGAGSRAPGSGGWRRGGRRRCGCGRGDPSRTAHRGPQAHRRAHGAEPAAHRAARHDRVRGGPRRGARGSLPPARGVRAPRSAAHPDRVLRAGGGRGDPRRARSQQPLDRYGARDPRADSHRRGDGGRGHGAARAGAARCRVARPVRHTFTISNHGVSGSLLAAPIIINQPQSAILGVGKLEKRPVVVDEGDEEKIMVRPRCYVTLTLDHRVMDGHRANRFLEVLVHTLGAWPA